VTSDRLVEDALVRALASGEVGVQVAAYRGDELVVDTAAGVTAAAGGSPVDGETLFPVFSISKAITGVALHRQAELGLVDPEGPVADPWPEFAAEGKDAITVRHVLSHRSGFPQMPPEVTPELMTDWAWMVRRLAEIQPLFPPDTHNTYQALSFGWLVGEVVRRTDPAGRTLGRFVRDEIGAPLGAPDLHIGLPAEERGRLAVLSSSEPPVASSPIRRAAVPDAVEFRPEVWNRADVLAAEIPGAGGVMTARSVARVFAMLANGGHFAGVRLLSPERVEGFTVPRRDALEPDEVLGEFVPVGQGGLWLGGTGPPANPIVGSGRRIVYHAGSGGSIAWADLDTNLAVAILHNRKTSAPWDLRSHPFGPIAEAVRTVAGI
jgi:CubicO group peptidase (beta-lactamase class C family)